MRANDLMKHNIRALLKGRHLSQRDLAQWCRRSDAWIGKILKEDRREFPMKYWDKIADFFGISVYQLVQPGISMLTERRRGDRRSIRDRRLRNVAAEAHGSALSDKSLIHEVLSLGADERIAVVELIAETRRSKISGSNTEQSRAVDPTTVAPTGPLRIAPKTPTKRR